VTWRTRSEVHSTVEAAGFEVMRVVPFLVLLSWPLEWPSLRKPWWLLMRAVTKLGPLSLALVYYLDTAMARLARSGPSTKLVVCRKL
jgi:hypothetical protein